MQEMWCKLCPLGLSSLQPTDLCIVDLLMSIYCKENFPLWEVIGMTHILQTWLSNPKGYSDCVYNVHYLHSWCLQMSEETSELGVTDGCKPSCGFWELNHGPLQEQWVLLTIKPSLLFLSYVCRQSSFKNELSLLTTQFFSISLTLKLLGKNCVGVTVETGWRQANEKWQGLLSLSS